MSQSDPTKTTYRDRLEIVVRDLTLSCNIGVSAGERRVPQRLRFNLVLNVARPSTYDDDFSKVVDYGAVVRQLRKVVAENECLLLETLADRVLNSYMEESRVCGGRLRIEKLDRYSDIAGLGIELQRER